MPPLLSGRRRRPSLRDEVLRDRAIGYWPLDEPSGTVAFDRSGNSRNGTYTGTITPGGRSSALGTAPDFGGGYVNIADNAAFSPQAGANGLLSIEAWAQIDVLGTLRYIFTKGDGGGYEWAIQANVGNFYTGIQWTPGGADAIGPVDGGVVNTQLHHIAWVTSKAAQFGFLYMDGVVIGSTNTSPAASSDGTSPVQIGRRGDGYANTWDGLIQHVAIFPTALSAARIKAHYVAGISW